MNKRKFITGGVSLAALGILGAGCTTTGGSSGDPAARRQAIDAAVDSALSRLFREARGSQEIVASARGVLVFPSVVSAGFIVGGSHGQGALRMRKVYGRRGNNRERRKRISAAGRLALTGRNHNLYNPPSNQSY